MRRYLGTKVEIEDAGSSQYSNGSCLDHDILPYRITPIEIVEY